MRLELKQRIFSWLDSYDIFDENGNFMYTVKSKLALSHFFEVYGSSGECLAQVRQTIFSFMPKFEIYTENEYRGSIKKFFTFFRPKYEIDFMGWNVEGEYGFLRWNYRIYGKNGETVAYIKKKMLTLSDTYTIDIMQENNALPALLLVLAIDAEECSEGKD